jgi:hypothetical protein
VFHTAASFLPPSIPMLIGFVLLCCYWAALLFQTALSAPRFGIVRAVAAFPLLFATHIFYGIGFWRGLFGRVSKTKPVATEVSFERPLV